MLKSAATCPIHWATPVRRCHTHSGSTCPCTSCADITSRPRLIDTGIDDANSGGTNTHAGSNADTRSPDTGGRRARTCYTAFGYTHPLTINGCTG